MELDPIRIVADRYFGKVYLNKNVPNSTLYVTFFTNNNYTNLINTIEHQYDLKVTDTYRHDILNAMLKCYEYHTCDLESMNRLVLNELSKQFVRLKNEQNRYKTTTDETQSTYFMKPLELPLHVSSRKESLSFSNALFGNKKVNFLNNRIIVIN